MRLLLVEDNIRLQRLLSASLRCEDYRVDVASSVADYQAVARDVRYDLFIIDLALPDGDGVTIIDDIRARDQAPILVITARATVADRVSGLDHGADDYLVKPFHTAELLARVRALLRRPSELRPASVRIGNIVFQTATGEVTVEGREIVLRSSERQLLGLLIRRAGSTVPKSSIDMALSEFDKELSANAIEVLVYRLRRALADRNTGLTIETVRGIGYRLKATQA